MGQDCSRPNSALIPVNVLGCCCSERIIEMKYTDLTIDQRIGLKGEFITNPHCKNYRLVWIMWDFVTAVEFFLNDDINALRIIK